MKKFILIFLIPMLSLTYIWKFSAENFYPTNTAAFSAVSKNETSSFAPNEKKPNIETEKKSASTAEPEPQANPKKDFIKWIDFNVSYEVLDRAYKTDLEFKKVTGELGESLKEIGTCELLAYVALKNGNSFKNRTTDLKTLNKLAAELKKGDKSSIERYQNNKYYHYYVNSYHAILDGIIGHYKNADGVQTYGLKGFHPIARGFWYSCYDDFGNARGYGYKRRHLGHDLFGSTGAPIIAVEDGTVTELGWNQYGGWRVGIRSNDTKRYYYYAHLRKDKPYPADLKKGDKITAGQVIGFLGSTGYSRKENVNMKEAKPHLHFGIQIIFDPSQEDGNGEIWIDCNTLCKFLSKNRMKVVKNPEIKEYQSENTTNIKKPDMQDSNETKETSVITECC